VKGEFATRLKELVEVLTWEIQQRTKSGLNLAKELNRALGSFIRNLLHIFHGNHAFHMVSLNLIWIIIIILPKIKAIVTDIASNNSETLIEFKFEFLKLVFEYEHFVQLNLPQPVIIDSIPNLLSDFSRY
jgi:hypothetical protein